MATLALPDLPRVRLLDGPTPLQPMLRLSEALGGRAEVWIKREDLGPLAFSGNKLRNLEFLLGAALRDGVDTIVTSGRRWSNHCRLTAAAGARLGLEVHVVLTGPRVDRSANRDLIEQLGANVHETRTDERAEREALVESVAERRRADGRRVKVLPVGGSEAAGAWGQVLAGLEVLEQADGLGFVPDAIVLPTATGGTQAGLVVGMEIGSLARSARHGGSPVPEVLGIVVAKSASELRPVVERLVAELAAMAGIDVRPDRIELDDSVIGAGYGLPSEPADAAADLLARSEGILVDPIYTAKALAGLVAHVHSGGLDGRRVIFWHGGGLPALFESLGT